MTKRKNIMITGAGGFIGKHLCRTLQIHEQYRIFADRGAKELQDFVKQDKNNRNDGISDITDQQYFRDYFGKEIDIIIHLAAKTSIEDSIKNPYSAYFTNVMGTLNLLEFAKENKVKYFIFLSTYVYGDPEYFPIDENHPLKPHSPYNKSKLLAENLCEYYSADYGINIVTLRPFCLYGPNNKESSLIPKIINRIYTDRPLFIGRQAKRDFLYIDDFTELVFKILSDFPEGYNVYNVGYGTSYEISDVVKKTAKLLQHRIAIRFEEKVSDVRDMIADISKVSREFDWQPKIGVNLGLKLIVRELQRLKEEGDVPM